MAYEEITVEIPGEIQDKLVEVYVLNNLSGASIDAFYASYDSSAEGGNRIEDQLYAAILNEMINDALHEEIERLKAGGELKIEDNVDYQPKEIESDEADNKE